jgi:hypothetical protein
MNESGLNTIFWIFAGLGLTLASVFNLIIPSLNTGGKLGMIFFIAGVGSLYYSLKITISSLKEYLSRVEGIEK